MPKKKHSNRSEFCMNTNCIDLVTAHELIPAIFFYQTSLKDFFLFGIATVFRSLGLAENFG